MTTDDREPSPILALARELHAQLRAAYEGNDVDLVSLVCRTTALAQDLCDAIEEDEEDRLPTKGRDYTPEEVQALMKPYLRTPNALTQRTLADADAGRGLTGYASVDEMFAAIAMNLIEMDDDLGPENESR